MKNEFEDLQKEFLDRLKRLAACHKKEARRYKIRARIRMSQSILCSVSSMTTLFFGVVRGLLPIAIVILLQILIKTKYSKPTKL